MSSPKPSPTPLHNNPRLLKWAELQELSFEIPKGVKAKVVKKQRSKKGPSGKLSATRRKKEMLEKTRLSRMQEDASASLKRSETCRYSLPRKFSQYMHRQNIEDSKER